MMKAILSCIQDKSQFNGNLYYNLDYYSLSLLYDNNIKLIIITKSNYIDILKTIINDRYPNIKYNNIIIITIFPLLSKYKFKSIIINSFDYIYLKPYIISKKIYIIHSLVPNNNKQQKTFYIDKNIHSYSGYKYNRWYKYTDKIYYENIGKLLFEFIYYNKKSIYSNKNKCIDDGLTYMFNRFGLSDNKDFALSDILSKYDVEQELLDKEFIIF